MMTSDGRFARGLTHFVMVWLRTSRSSLRLRDGLDFERISLRLPEWTYPTLRLRDSSHSHEGGLFEPLYGRPSTRIPRWRLTHIAVKEHACQVARCRRDPVSILSASCMAPVFNEHRTVRCGCRARTWRSGANECEAPRGRAGPRRDTRLYVSTFEMALILS